VKALNTISPSGTAAGSAGTESAYRVADVLAMFITGDGSRGVSAISRELGISKAVVHRILQSLVARDFVTQDPGHAGYRLGPAAVALGARALRESDLRRAARAELDELRAVTRETSTLSELVGDRRAYIAQFLSPQEVHMSVELGTLYPLHAGSSGNAILAFLSPADQERVVARPLERHTDKTITDLETLRTKLAVIVERGYAVSHGERLPDAASVAAPIFDVDGHVIGSLSVCGPVRRFTEDVTGGFGILVREAALRVSNTLGYTSRQVNLR
jgi:IclR family transcriptional regulator, acetate operon repressor